MTVAPRVCLAIALAGAATTAWAAPAQADTFFQAQTTATAVHLTVTQQPASSIITASLVDDAVAYAASDFDSGASSEALAAPAFPGRLVVQGPQLLCSQLFSCPTQPPPYPFLADASYPRRQQDTATVSGNRMGSGPFVVAPLNASAQANADGNTGQTAAATTTLLAGTPGVVQIGASHATSTVQSSSKDIKVHVESVVHDVSIGGVLDIAALHAVDDIVLQPGGKSTNVPSITVSGVTFAGKSASIDGRGVHVAGVDGPAANRELAQRGVVVRTVGVHHSGAANGARSDATALSIDVALPVKGLPYIPDPVPALPPPFDQIPHSGVNANGTYVGQITLGAVGAAVGIGQEPTFNLGGAGQVPPASTGSSAPLPATGGPAPAGGAVTGSAPPPNQPGPNVAAQPPALAGGFTNLLARDRLDLLYAVLALGTAALFISWRGSVLLSQRQVPIRRRRP
ncbi:MAG TPA: hypothetical protein VFT62_09560 [Mycobacteriales bacterium]|nr:hypothetical protein [Mycobacteriales bacterium]